MTTHAELLPPGRRRLRPGLSVAHAPSDTDYASALSRHASIWSQQNPAESDLRQMITHSVIELVHGARGSAILVIDGPDVAIHAKVGLLPDLRRLPTTTLRQERQMPDPPPAGGWPIFAARYGPTGDSRVLCTPLRVGRATFGTLLIAAHNPSRTLPSAISALAIHASLALAAARQIDQLRSALNSRDVIGQAKGILMERHRICADEAFSQLSRLSQNTNTKMRDLCAYITETGDIPRLPAPTDHTFDREHKSTHK